MVCVEEQDTGASSAEKSVGPMGDEKFSEEQPTETNMADEKSSEEQPVPELRGIATHGSVEEECPQQSKPEIDEPVTELVHAVVYQLYTEDLLPYNPVVIRHAKGSKRPSPEVSEA